MNLARVEYYFADFLSLLQLDTNERWIQVLPEYIEQKLDSVKKTGKCSKELEQLKRYHRFKIPPNVRFVGTINDDDTTNSLSPKVVDRSIFIEFSKDDYSDDEEIKTPEGYYPLSFFTVEPNSSANSIFDNENGRFKKYVGQMLGLYTERFNENNLDIFADYLITTKILPALQKQDDFINSKYFDEKYKLSKDRFEIHNPKSGEYYNYLGGY